MDLMNPLQGGGQKNWTLWSLDGEEGSSQWLGVRRGCNVDGKGAPARESHTGTRLVSPAASGEKKNRPLQNRAPRPQIWYIRT